MNMRVNAMLADSSKSNALNFKNRIYIKINNIYHNILHNFRM